MDNYKNKPLRGIIAPMITPLEDNDNLDVPGLERLVEHILGGGVHGLFVLGTTGEAPGLGYKMRHELVELVCRLVGDRAPVLVGITDTSQEESLRLAATAAASGAYALVSAPPYYFQPGQAELIEYYDHLVKRLPLPLYLYNMPVHTKVYLEPGTVREIAKNEKVLGLKDSSANAAYFQSVLHAVKDIPDFSLFIGPEEATAGLILMGGHGGVNGGANMFPKLYVNMFDAASKRDFERLSGIQDRIMQISSKIYRVGRFGSSYLKGLKCVLSLMGICNDFMAEPFHKFKEEERLVVEKMLHEIDYRSLL